MGVDFFLACDCCREFIELHKWAVVENAGRFLVDAHVGPDRYPGQRKVQDSPYPFVDLDTSCKKVLITAERIEGALAVDVPDVDYIRKLTPFIREFAAWHRGHRLFLLCDMAQEPWFSDEPGFAEWKMIPAEFNFHRYLPRNLIEVEGLLSWTEVLEVMRNEWPFEYAYHEQMWEEIEAIRVAYEELLAKRR